MSDALRRRCLYHHVDFPSEDKELRIVTARIPGIELALATQVVRFVQGIRKEDLRKKPGVAETLDWATALIGMEVKNIAADPEAVHESLMCLLKTQEDRASVSIEVVERLAGKAV